MTVIRKNRKVCCRNFRRLLDNEDSIQMELETSENMEKELNEKISQLQIRLEQTKKEEGSQLKQTEEVHLSLASLEQQDNFILENMIRIEEEIQILQ